MVKLWVYGPNGIPFHIYKKDKWMIWTNVTLSIHVECNHIIIYKSHPFESGAKSFKKYVEIYLNWCGNILHAFLFVQSFKKL